MTRNGLSPDSLEDDPLLVSVPFVDGHKVLEPAILESCIGDGGMGAVYKGKHRSLHIDVAVKCLKPELVGKNESVESRFKREAHLAAKLTHQNLVRLYEFRQAHGLSYLILEYIEGENAEQRVARKGRLGEREATKILLATARGLAMAHQHPEVIVHRDIKPANILISNKGEVKLADLGIAKAIERIDQTTFKTEGLVGTPRYMAPEQWDLKSRPSPRMDIWSLGATLYFLLTGKHALQGKTHTEILHEAVHGEFPDPRVEVPGLSSELVRILLRCTLKNPDQRYADARALSQDLQEFLLTPQPSWLKRLRRRDRSGARLWIGLALSLVLVAAGVGYWIKSGGRVPEGWDVVDRSAGKFGWAKRVREPSTGIILRLIEPGDFLMGSHAKSAGHDEGEEQHRVDLTRPFYLAETKTTRAQLLQKPDEEFDGHNDTADDVPWEEAMDFCKRIGGSLPTEAQWEFAARAGKMARFWWGDEFMSELAGSVNGFGIGELSGSGWEWCLDDYRADYERLPTIDPLHEDKDAVGKVLRGGLWTGDPNACRLAERRPGLAGDVSERHCFRLALTLPEPPKSSQN